MVEGGGGACSMFGVAHILPASLASIMSLI